MSEVVLWAEAVKVVRLQYAGLSDSELKYLVNSYLISSQIRDVFDESCRRLDVLGLSSVSDVQSKSGVAISFSSEMQEKNKALREYLFSRFYSSPNVYRMNQKGQILIRRLFEVFCNDVKLLPLPYQKRVCEVGVKERVVCDYIAGMTDTFVLQECSALF